MATIVASYQTVRRRFAASFTALAGALALAVPLSEAQDLYWTQGSVIMGSDIDGTNVFEVFDGSGMAGTAVDVAVTADHVYWTDKNDTPAGGVWRADRNGDNASLFVSNPGTEMWAPQFIAIDEDNGRLYFSDWFLGLFSADLATGGDVVSLGAPNGDVGTTGLALRGGNEIISVTGIPDNGVIYSTNIAEATHIEYWWVSGGGGHYGLAYDSALDTIYYSGYGAGVLYSLNLGVLQESMLLGGLAQPLGVALSESASHLVYVEQAAGRISTYSFANAQTAEIVGVGASFGVAIFGDPPPPPGPPPPIAGWQKIDDFNERPLGSIDGQGAWTQVGNYMTVIENPYGEGRVLRVAFGRGSHRIIIPEGETGTLFFRARPFGNDDFSFGASRSEVLTNFGVSTGQFAFRGNGRLDIVDNTPPPNHIRTLGVYDPHTWYDVWIVVNNSANTAKYYVRGGEFTEQTLLESAGGATEFTHRSPAAGDIQSFGVQGFGRAPMLVDQVWINAIEEDLTDPIPPQLDSEPPVHAGPLLAYEGFDYEPGSILHLDGGHGWIYGHFVFGANVAPRIASPGWEWPSLETAGNRVVADSITADPAISYRFIDTNAIAPNLLDSLGQIGNAGEPVYVSFLMQGIPSIHAEAIGFALFNSHQERVFVGKGSGETTQQGWKLHGGGTLNQYTGIPYEEQSFFVLRVEGNTTHLFHNPDPAEDEPGVSTAVAAITAVDTLGNYGFNNIRLLGRGNGISFDEIRVGTTWAAVTPVPGATDGFAAWQDQHFGPGADPAIAGPEADPDGDGIKNLLEYALGRDPLAAGSGGLPAHGTIDIDEAVYLTLTFNRPIGLADIHYAVEESEDLSSWSGSVFVNAVPIGDGTEDVVYRRSEPIASSSRGFLQLRVTLD